MHTTATILNSYSTQTWYHIYTSGGHTFHVVCACLYMVLEISTININACNWKKHMLAFDLFM